MYVRPARLGEWLKEFWPLLIVLIVQAALSLRLIWTNTAFLDEATYLYAGHQMIAHWLHGIPVVEYPLSLSGSVALYPPLGAMADAVGGLAGARILSLLFMLGATTLLHGCARRLFGRRAAAFAAILFVSLGGTQFLGAFATFDAMALFLLVLSSYLVVRFGDVRDLRGVLISDLLAALVLAIADATKYATALWNPIVIGLAFVVPIALGGASPRQAALRAVRFTGVLVILILAALYGIGGSEYVKGIKVTTLNRSASMGGAQRQSATDVFQHAWTWIGFVVVLAAVAVVVLYLKDRRGLRSPFGAIGLLLLAASVAAPLNQARIGTLVSLQKHVVYGAWFGCVAAGYLLAVLLRQRRVAMAGAAVILAILPLALSVQARGFYRWSTENPRFIADLKPMVHAGNDRYLIEGYNDVPAYYLGTVESEQWRDGAVGDFVYYDPVTHSVVKNGPSFAAAIKNRFFTLIIVNYTEPSDRLIKAAIERYGDYRVLATLPPSQVGSKRAYTVWTVVPKSG